MPTDVEASTHISRSRGGRGVKDHEGLGTVRVQDHHLSSCMMFVGCDEVYECWGILTRSEIGLGGGCNLVGTRW